MLEQSQDQHGEATGVFDAYAAYYDLLYRDKDYATEADYIHSLIQRYKTNSCDILELGCGTGGHASCLARYGYRVTGLDRSEAMVSQAQTRAASWLGLSEKGLGKKGLGKIEFAKGDLRDFRAGKTFDVVLALFHVMSYQTSNDDLMAAMATAAAHLQPGGLFIFDCWYGPGVLSDPPATRVRRLKSNDVLITRIAEPDHRPNENCVDVRYDVIVEGPCGLERIQEIHSMRYLFSPEVDLLFKISGLRRLSLLHWLKNDSPSLESWNACFVATK